MTLNPASGSGAGGIGTSVEVLCDAAAKLAADLVPEVGSAALEEAEALLRASGLVALAAEQRIGVVQNSRAHKTAGYAGVPSWLRARAGGRLARSSAVVARRNAMQFQRLPRVVAALLDGSISHDMASAIAAAVACLGKDADVADTEDILLRLAWDESSSPEKVALVGRHLRSVLDPDGDLSDEDKAYGDRFLATMIDDKGGMTGRFYLPPEPAAKLQELLDKYARLRDAADDRTKTQRQADVFIELLNEKVATAIMLLVNAETLPDDHPARRESGQENADHSCEDGVDANPGNDGSSGDGVSDVSSSDRADRQASSGSAGSQPMHRPIPNNGTTATTSSNTNNHSSSNSSKHGTAHANATSSNSTTRENNRAVDDSGAGESRWTGGSSPDSSPNFSTGTRADSPDSSPDSGPCGSTGNEWCGELDDEAKERLRVALANLGQTDAQEPDPLPCPTCGRAANRLAPGLLMPTGHPLPAKHTHRLLYTSQLFRVVVDAESRIVDTSYSVRFVPDWMRRLVLLRYDTCAYDDCPLEATYCQMDHVFDWARFNRTKADEIIPACSHHNRDRAKHPGKYRLQKLPDSRWKFTTVQRRN